MTGYQCVNCEYSSITETVFCPQCGHKGLNVIQVPTKGKVYSYTTIHVAPPEFISLAPYQVALVELTDHLKVTAFLEEDIKIGDEVFLKEIKNQKYIFTVN